ncbi:hypothetical protein AX15_004651 [Amanita polypyramis BW_CC]|nr:hypothetical protein AX15_004651 [Amanita polypyramis BW_CC]
MTLTGHTIKVTSVIHLFVLALEYGIYLTTAVHFLRALVCNNGGRRNTFTLTVSVALFLSLTAMVATNFKATIVVQDLEHRPYNILNTAYNALQIPIFQIVDAVLIYRCWVVYGRAWKIICVPILLWFLTLAFSTYATYVFVLELTKDGVTDKLLARSAQFSSGFAASNIALNIYATIAIVYRVISVTKHSGNQSGRLHQTWRIIAESGALYTLSSIMNLIASILFSRNPNSESYVVFLAVADPSAPSMACVAFNLILIHVYQQRQQISATNRDIPLSSDSLFVKDKRRQLSPMRFFSTETTDSESSRNLSTNMDHQSV